MMYSKAMLFLDRKIASIILGCNNSRELKELGKKVKYFEEIVWDFNNIILPKIKTVKKTLLRCMFAKKQ